jgi:hypothetical protein
MYTIPPPPSHSQVSEVGDRGGHTPIICTRLISKLPSLRYWSLFYADSGFFDGNNRVVGRIEREHCRYGEAQAAAASWRAHDGRRQRGTVCPRLYMYRLTHTYCSLARLPPTHPFVGAPILQRHFQVPWRARVPPPSVRLPHTCTQDGWFLQPKRRPARLPRRAVPSDCVCRCG